MMQKHKKMTAALAVLLVVGIAFLAISSNRSVTDAKTMSVMAETAVTGDVETSSENLPTINMEAALAKRAMGDENAPVLIEEYASLSCSHCASFHKETLEKLKEEYIDTGKVRFVFNDFPLNASALDGAMTSRCLPEKNYFKFLSFLFQTQDDWAFESNYKAILEQNAKLLGLGSEEFKSCLGNQALRAGLLEIMSEAQSMHGIKSTPSFVVNGEMVITGNRSIEQFRKIIDPLLPSEENKESGE